MHSATYDDLVRMVQFNSRAALTQARTLNREYLAAVLTQLNTQLETMRAQVAQSADNGIGLLENLNSRLQGIETLIPAIQQLLAQNNTLSAQYEKTCQSLLQAFRQYTKEVATKESTLITQSNEQANQLKRVEAQLQSITGRLNEATLKVQDNNAILHSNRAHRTMVRYVTTVASGLGLLGILVWLVSNSNHAMETNASLHETL